MSPRRAAAGVALFAAFSLAAAGAVPARASTEEFSTFSAIAQEEDDESTIDHLLAAAPADWRSDWEHSTNALRTTQGCLTSGQWLIDTRLKLETSMGDRARFGLDYTDHQSDDASYTNTDLLFHWPLVRGRATAMFRPFHDKSRQDFGLGWGFGSDTSAVRLEAMWVFEDMFNNLWAWRQTRVGGDAEPYTRHPWEPNLSFAVRREHLRFQLDSRYLTPSVRHVIDASGAPFRVAELWGAYAEGALEVDAVGVRWHLAGGNKQARSVADANAATPDSVGLDFRRQWWVKGGLDRGLGFATVRWRWLYVERSQDFGPPIGSGVFHSVDRVQQVELTGSFLPAVAWRAGWMHDHINIGTAPGVPGFTWGTRGENRLYLGLDLRFSKVRTAGTEGIELDREPYEVAHHHDKGFLSLQSSF